MGITNRGENRFLLDTHVLLWWFFDDPRLSRIATDIISNPDHIISVSSASGWEISTKYRLGKLPGAGSIVEDLPRLLRKARIEVLPISLDHALLAGKLNNTHRDPFDRMLAAQSMIESLPLITSDAVFKSFSLKVLW
jgi:PIN domain nuclease of toxin-antitoxin system